MSTRASVSSNQKRRWALELTSGNRREKGNDLVAPPGYSSVGQESPDNQNTSGNAKLVTKKSWDVALAPIKNIPMSMLLLYMAGSTISIFPVMMVGMTLVRQIKALWSVSATFSTFENSDQAVLQKATFLFGNLVQLGMALYKCHSMGLLPTHASDWLAFQEPALQVEYVHGGLGLW